MKPFEIQWHGPYRWYGTQDDVLFAQPEAKQAGVYLWTIPFEGQNLTYYVGATGRSFGTRFEEHTREILSGRYRVYDPARFAKGEKVPIWEGMWGRRETRPRMEEFLNQYLELAPRIYEFLDLFKTFIAPLDCDQRIRERSEAGIADWLHEQSGLVGAFQDKGIKYRRRRPDETPVRIKMEFPETILGLCNELEI